AVHLRHLDIHEDEVGMERPERPQRRLAAVRGGDVVAGLEDHAEGLPPSPLVVHPADPRPVAPAGCPVTPGSSAVNVPSARPCGPSSRPPCASMMRWLTHGPTSIRFSWTT